MNCSPSQLNWAAASKTDFLNKRAPLWDEFILGRTLHKSRYCLLDPQKLHDIPKLQQQQPAKHRVSFPLRHCLRTAVPVSSLYDVQNEQKEMQRPVRCFHRNDWQISGGPPPMYLCHISTFLCSVVSCLSAIFHISTLNPADGAAPERTSDNADFMVLYYRTFWT